MEWIHRPKKLRNENFTTSTTTTHTPQVGRRKKSSLRFGGGEEEEKGPPPLRDWPKEQIQRKHREESMTAGGEPALGFVKFVVKRKLGKPANLYGLVEGLINMFDWGPVNKYKPTSCHLRCMRVFSWQHPNEVRAATIYVQ